MCRGYSLGALAGTGSVSSPQMHGESCGERHHRHGTITSAHPLLGAALLHPDRRAGMPRMPEPMVQHAGTENNAGEREAAKRLIVKLRQDHPPLKGIVTDDRLRANAPPIHGRHDHHVHDMLGVKAGDQASVLAQVAVAEQAGRVTYDDRDDPETGRRHRCRYVSAVPLQASHADLRGNFLACWEWDKDTVQPVRWGTDLRVNTGTVSQLMRGGRARWRIDNETCNTRKNHGDHGEHHDGHGSQPLSVVCAVLLLWAF